MKPQLQFDAQLIEIHKSVSEYMQRGFNIDGEEKKEA